MRSNRSKILVLGRLVLSAAIVVGSASGAGAAVTTLGRFALEKGRPVFWDGPAGIDGDATDRLDGCEQRRCIDYELEVSESAPRLRVALDKPDFLQQFAPVPTNPPDDPLYTGDDFFLSLIDPNGVVVFASVWNFYSVDLTVPNPMPGVWRARVTWSETNTDSTFRMRAKLEANTPNDTGSKLRMPNLRMIPPFDLVAGLDFAVGFPPPDVASTGCLAEEVVAYGARQCLRFSMGPENIGGPLELRFEPGGDAVEGGDVTQRVYCRDGSFDELSAGTYEYHAAHLHFHHAGFAFSELYRVLDPVAGTLSATPVGVGPKQGFCMGDTAIARWHSFANDSGPRATPDCGLLLSGTGMGASPLQPAKTALTAGWADVYAYYQEGQFVEFGDNPSGLYVVRARANKLDSINETTTADNTSYALLEIERDPLTQAIRVKQVVERGYGTDPWDPQKRIATDIRNETVAD